MSKIKDLLAQGRYQELWQLCCGFLDLNLEGFMKIQGQLLLEQIDMLKGCKMGRKMMHGRFPKTVSDFRERVPLTTYRDYCPELVERREDGLPATPVHWIQTSGRSAEYPYKWVPVSRRFWDEAGLNFCAIAMLGACRSQR